MKEEVTINGETFRRRTYTNVRGGTTHYWQSDRRDVSSQKFAALQRGAAKTAPASDLGLDLTRPGLPQPTQGEN